MTRPPITLRTAVLLGLTIGLLGAAVAVGAVEEPRQRPGSTSPPVTVYVSEELDISDVRETDGGRIDDDPVTFQRVNGTEEFRVEDPERANFTGVSPGSYDSQADVDERPELSVVQPRVTRLRVLTSRSDDVTNGTVRERRLRALTVVAEYDFAEADRLQVTMRHEGTSVGLDQRAARITESGGRYTIGMGDRPIGEYTITVTGSAIEAGSRSVTVEVIAADQFGTPTATATPTPTATPTETPTATEAATETATPTPAAQTPTEGRAPGPGVAGVLAALALTLALWARRLR